MKVLSGFNLSIQVGNILGSAEVKYLPCDWGGRDFADKTECLL